MVRCPIDHEVLRVRSFLTHAKQKHSNQPTYWSKRAQKEGVLVCISPTHHPQPAIELAANTRGGNDTFIQEHASHVGDRQEPLSNAVKQAVHYLLSGTDQVDLDASPLPPPPPPPPVALPNVHEAVGAVEPPTPSPLEQRDNDDVLQRVFSGRSPIFTPPGASSTFVGLDELVPSLWLDEQDPSLIEPQVAQLLTDAYQSIYEPGLRYPSQDDNMAAPERQPASTQVNVPEQQHASTSMSMAAPTDQSTQITAPEQQHASTNVTMTAPTDQSTQVMTPEQQHASTSMAQDDTEDIPLLTQSLDHIREVNQMKNVMLTQILQDNIELMQKKIDSRKKALKAMEELFEARTQEPMSDDIALELSRIIHLKNKFMKQVLQETSRLQQQLFNLLS